MLLTFRTAIKKDSAAALPQSLQQVFDHPTGGSTFNPPRLAVFQRGGVGLKKDVAQGQCKLPLDLQGMGADQYTGEEARHVPRTRRQYRFVKIVQVKVRQAIVAFIASEVFQMQVAVDPGPRGLIQRACVRPILIEQMTGPAQEGEGIFPHSSILAAQALRVATVVVGNDALETIDSLHRYTLPHTSLTSRAMVALVLSEHYHNCWVTCLSMRRPCYI